MEAKAKIITMERVGIKASMQVRRKYKVRSDPVPGGRVGRGREVGLKGGGERKRGGERGVWYGLVEGEDLGYEESVERRGGGGRKETPIWA